MRETGKEKIAEKLMELLEEKALEQVTVKELTAKLGVSRQTFYYYFHDIYEIVEWIFERESEVVLSEFGTIDSWQYGYVLMMKWLQNHRTFVLHCYRSVQKEYVQNFMNRILYQYIEHVVRTQAEDMNVTEEQVKFITRFFTLAINAISLEWIGEGMKEEPARMAERVNMLIQGDFQKALKNFELENLRSLH